MRLRKKIENLNNYIIAEIGTNHNRSKSKAINMIYELSKTKCDCVKFQIYEPNEIVNKKVLCKDYGLDKIYGKITAYEMFKSSDRTKLSELSEFNPKSPYAEHKFRNHQKVLGLRRQCDWNI